MTRYSFQTVVLSIAGFTALVVGTSILVSPHAFYESYGTTIGDDPNLLSDLRATSATLFALGMMMLAGVRTSEWRHHAGILATVVFLAFPAGRTVGLIVDGSPSVMVLGALGIEVAIGLLCLAGFVGGPARASRISVARG